jgi:hypothetical protein
VLIFDSKPNSFVLVEVKELAIGLPYPGLFCVITREASTRKSVRKPVKILTNKSLRREGVGARICRRRSQGGLPVVRSQRLEIWWGWEGTLNSMLGCGANLSQQYLALEGAKHDHTELNFKQHVLN